MISWIAANLWLIPTVPLAISLLILSLANSRRTPAVALAVTGQLAAFLMSIAALASTLQAPGSREFHNFTWFTFGDQAVRIGWVLDPLAAAAGPPAYPGIAGREPDRRIVGQRGPDRIGTSRSPRRTDDLGVVIANSLLLLFICWELVGLASYLLIGFWIHKPSAAAAAKKAFITTRIGDLGFFLGIFWLYGSSGTLLFYDDGKGCLEAAGLLAIGSRKLSQRTLVAALGDHALVPPFSVTISDGSPRSGRVRGDSWGPGEIDLLATGC